MEKTFKRIVIKGIVMILAIVAIHRATAGSSSSDQVSVRLSVSVVSSMRITEADLGGRDMLKNAAIHLGQLSTNAKADLMNPHIRSFQDQRHKEAAFSFLQRIGWVQMGQGEKDNVISMGIEDVAPVTDSPQLSIVDNTVEQVALQIPASLEQCRQGETLNPKGNHKWNQIMDRGGNRVSANSALAECVLLNTSMEDSPNLAQSISVYAR